jgi:CheY-like chemotaxis protein
MPKLLLADDSITIQRVIELTFSGEDVQVMAVGDGDEAIARITAEPPDIVLADIGMPKRSGYDVAAFVKNDPALAHIPVLLLAGAFEPVDQARADQVRCDGVLVKPFEPQQVIARVRELIDGAQAQKPRARPDDAGVRRPDVPVTPPAPEPRVVESRPVVEIPDPRAARPVSGDDAGGSLDDYFDRLDAAFASLGTAPSAGPPAPALDDLAEQIVVPTIDDLLGGVPQTGFPGEVVPPPGRMASAPIEPPDSTPTLTPSRPTNPDAAASHRAAPPASTPATPSAESARNLIADVFSALLAVEQGDPDAATRLPLARPPVVTDDLVDEVTRRVLERLAPDAANGLVARLVSEVAERLVREEIARIRGQS